MAESNSLKPSNAEEVGTTSSKRMISFQCETSEFVGVSANRLIIQGDMRSEIHIHEGKHNDLEENNMMFQVKDPIETFTGRKKDLKKLHQSIQQCRNQEGKISIFSHIIPIIGLGGIGKTETVRMYIKQYGEEYDNVVWIDAEHRSEAVAQFKFLAERHLKICVREQAETNLEFSHTLAQVYQKLCQKPKRLLIIFDSAKALDDSGSLKNGIRQFLPVQTTAIEPPIVLVTSRHQSWKELNGIHLDLWDTEECIDYICTRLKLEDTPGNRKDAGEMALLFNRMPVAIQMGVSVILEQSENNRSISDKGYFIQNLKPEHTPFKPDLEGNEPQTNETTVQDLLHMSLGQIKRYEQGKLAIRILGFMAYLSPTQIPKVVIQWLLDDTDEHILDRALALLLRYSIIQRYGTMSFTIQKVFQDLIIMSLRSVRIPGSKNLSLLSECKGEMTILGELTNTFITRIDIEDLTEDDHKEIISNIVHTTEYIVQHSMIGEFYGCIETVALFVKSVQYNVAIKYLTALINHDINIAKSPPKVAFNKLKEIASIYYINGEFQNALETYMTLLHGGEIFNQLTLNSKIVISQGQEKVLGELHSLTLETKHEIGLCLNDLGRLEEALKFNYQVLKAREQLLGPFDPSTLAVKCNIALCLSRQGKKEEALILYYEVLKAEENVLGSHHRSTLTTKNNIAVCLSDQGKEEEALKLYYDVLEGREKLFGSLHPSTLSTKNNIAVSLSAQGNKKEALKLYHEVLAGEEKLLGASHPGMLQTKNNIAVCLNDLGRKEEALRIYHHVLEGREKLLGARHPSTLLSQNNMAVCLSEQGKHEEALQVFWDVLKVRKEVIGDLHRSTIMTKYHIANCLSAQGKEKEALELYLDVLRDEENVLGALHPSTLKTKNTIAVCLNDQGKQEEALKLHYDILKDRENVLGALHQDTLATKSHIARSLSIQGRKEEASKLYFDVLEAQVKLIGASHPETLNTKSSIATSLSSQGKKEEALKLYYDVLEARKNSLGALHPYTLIAKHNIALCLSNHDDQKEALKLFYDVLKAQVKLFGDAHPDSLSTKNSIAYCLSAQGKKDRALKLYYDVLKGRIEIHGPRHPGTLMTKNNIAVCLSGQENHEEALKLYYDVLESQEKLLGPVHPDTLLTKNNIAFSLCCQGQKEEASKLYYFVLDAREKLLGALHPSTLTTKQHIALYLADHTEKNYNS